MCSSRAHCPGPSIRAPQTPGGSRAETKRVAQLASTLEGDGQWWATMRKRIVKPAPRKPNSFTAYKLRQAVRKAIAKVREKKRVEPAVREMSDFEHKLVSLLDRIEVEQDPTLASLRFALAEEQGYTVVVTSERTSGEMN